MEPTTVVETAGSFARQFDGATAGQFAIGLLFLIGLIGVWIIRRLMPHWVAVLQARARESEANSAAAPRFASSFEELSKRLPASLAELHRDVRGVRSKVDAIAVKTGAWPVGTVGKEEAAG